MLAMGDTEVTGMAAEKKKEAPVAKKPEEKKKPELKKPEEKRRP